MCRGVIVALTAVAVVVGGCSSTGSSNEATSGAGTPGPTPTTPSTDPPPGTTEPTAPSTDPPPGTTDRPETRREPEETRPPPTPPPTGSGVGDFSAISPIVQSFVDDRGLDGAGLIVVDRDDGVIHHEHWGEFDADRISFVASSSKMITAGVLMHLDDRGLLDVDAPIAEVVEWGAGNPAITPAQLVSNSSGLVGLLDDLTYEPYLCQWSPDGTMQDCARRIFTTPADDADVVEPDTAFRYGGAQWQIAGAVAEAVSGTSWTELIEEIYVEPCGLETLGYNNHFTQFGPGGFRYPAGFDGDVSVLAATDNPNMEGGAYITTGDYGELLLMHLRGGWCGDTPVLSPASLARMHGDRIAEAYGGDAYDPGTGYGMGWWVDRRSGLITDPGAYGSVAWLDLTDGYGAYLVIEQDSDTGNELAELLYDVVDEAVTGR